MERAEEKIRSANLLFENNIITAAISEAYYAMFRAATALLTLKSIYPKTPAGVVSLFGLQFVNEGIIEDLYANSFAKAQKTREKADYDLYYESTIEGTETIIDDAEKFLKG